MPTDEVKADEVIPKVDPTITEDKTAEPKVEEIVKATEEKPVETEPEKAIKRSPSSDEWRTKKMQERIDRLTREKSAAEAALAAKQQTGTPPDPADDAAISARIDALAQTKAEVLTAQRAFDARCLEVVEQGKKTFADFDNSVKELIQIADMSNAKEAAQYTSFIDAIIETGEGARLIHDLASDPAEAERIFKLSPVKQGMALAKLASVETEPVSNAPKPIVPIGNRAGTRIPIDPRDVARADTLSTAEWISRRNQQVAEDSKTKRGY